MCLSSNTSDLLKFALMRAGLATTPRAARRDLPRSLYQKPLSNVTSSQQPHNPSKNLQGRQKNNFVQSYWGAKHAILNVCLSDTI